MVALARKLASKDIKYIIVKQEKPYYTMTIASIRKKLQEFNKAASSDPSKLQSSWHKIFKTELSNKSANAFADYYRNMRPSKLMRSQTKKQRGGVALNPAPLSYETVPGANVAVYGRFPVEAGTDMPSIHNMDIYFQNSLTAGCGVQDSSLRVPVDMGSNKVGGRRTGRSKRAQARKTYRKRNNRKAPHGTLRRRRGDRKRGGSLLESIGMRPYMATPPPNPVQLASNSWSGMAAPVSGRPEIQAWNYRSSGVDGLINPGMVSHIDSDFNKMASPAPWQTPN